MIELKEILNLDGYLHCIRRLSQNKWDFWAESFPIATDQTESFERYLSLKGVEFIGSEELGPKGLEPKIRALLKPACPNESENFLKLLAWDIVEYLQQSNAGGNAEDSSASWQESFTCTAKLSFHGEYVYIILCGKSRGVAVGFASRA